jgi:type II secretory ATPase GspE/PulE/Tfp pilus assembly ATPase PilB-like protein
LSKYKNTITKRQGLVLICCPTGSGKTTTLYTTIQSLKIDRKKIVSIEDPCEYQLDGITQIEVNKDIGFDHEAGLKAILRGDPDIILI